MSVSNAIEKMSCYILAGSNTVACGDEVDYDMEKIERGYRKYARIFEDVKLVLTQKQAKEKFLNYPHVCEQEETPLLANSLKAALKDSKTDYIFVGSADITNFSLELPVNLIKEYGGESFMGYDFEDQDGSNKFQFGIYNKKLLSKLLDIKPDDDQSIDSLLLSDGRLLKFPEGMKISY